MLRRDASYGRGTHVIDDLTAECHLDQDALRERLLETFRSPQYQPPLLPAAALELLQLTRKPRVGTAEVVDVLGHDPMLAGRVLKLARSAAYCSGEPLRSLPDAVLRLGIARIADLFLQVSLDARVFRAPGFSEPMSRLCRHSSFTAEAARLISQQTSGLDEYAFLCGLLHDVGVAACILALSGPLRDLAPGGMAQAWPCIRLVHAGCSRMLADFWGLPADVGLVLSMHDEPGSGDRVHPLAAAVHLADAVAARVGFGFLDDAEASDADEAARTLGLSRADWARLTVGLKQLAERMGTT